ncbi:MAG: helix-turn-helix domain-containing protein [Ignavibacteria bacterium]
MNEPSEANEMHDEENAPASEAVDEAIAAEEMALPPEEPPPLPGSFLREAREARKLSVFEVAQSLKFSPRQIEALEADDYTALPPGATFRRGFVRGYAKLLKLDPNPLLAMLDVQMPVAPADVREPQNMGVAATPVAAGSRSSRPMLFGSVALAVFAVALGAWHYLGTPGEPAAVKPSAPAAPPPANTTTMQAPDIRVESTPAAAPGQPPAPGSAAVTPADLHQLVFVFQDKSWVEVTDASQKVIFSAENAPGTRQAVSGKPPFQIVIGNAAKVELQYDDRQIDLKPYTRAEVARLTLE